MSTAETQVSSGGAKQKRGNKAATLKKQQQLMPQLKTIERVFKWPVIEITWKQGTEVYGKIKGE